MDDSISIQQKLFKNLKNLDHSQVSFVHLVSELLGISYDSSYRRIRDEKSLSINELVILATHFHVSIDDLVHGSGRSLYFQQFPIVSDSNSFYKWLEFILNELKLISKTKKENVIYAARDIPIFYYFDFPDLIEFKFFMWQRMLLGISSYQEKNFTLSGNLEAIHYELGNKILDYYIRLPIIELWNYETFNGIMHQVEYAWLSGFFSDKSECIQLCHSLDDFLHHIQKQVAKSTRIRLGSEINESSCNYTVYLNEVFLADNTILVENDVQNSIIMTYNTLNILKTHNEVFFTQVKSALLKLIESAILISGTSAKERNHFFSGLHEKLQKFVESVKQQ